MRTRLHSRIGHIAAPIVVLATAALVVSGCASSEPTEKPATPTATSALAAVAAFPVAITAKNGPVMLSSQPKKIVSLSPTATEDLFAIGAGSQVVAVDVQSNFPTAAPKTDLSGFKASVEAISKYNPDRVIVADDMSKIVEQLTKVGVPVFLDDPATSLDDAYAQITQLGKATGHADGAAAVVADMKAKIAVAVASVKKPATPLTYYYEVGNAPYFGATSKTFIGSIFSQFGLTNIADAAETANSGYPQLSDEYIVKAAPDLVFLDDTLCCRQTSATVVARPGWAQVPAVTNATAKGTVVGMSDDVASRWGPRLVDLVQQIAGAVNKAQG